MLFFHQFSKYSLETFLGDHRYIIFNKNLTKLEKSVSFLFLIIFLLEIKKKEREKLF